MKYAIVFAIFLTGIFMMPNESSAQRKFLVSTFSWAEANKAANTGIGTTCLYTMPGGRDTMFVFSLSYSSGTAVIKINGSMQVLTQVGISTSEIFENDIFRVWSKMTPNDSSSRTEGILNVRNKKTKVLNQVRVFRECSV